MSKYFVVNPSIQLQDKNIINKLRQENEIVLAEGFVKKREADISKLSKEDNLKHIEGRVVVKVDVNSKDSWTFEDGKKIEYVRRFENFNVRQTNPVNAHVISGEGVKKGAEILIHPNALHDTNRIFDYKDDAGNVQYYSIHNDMCFAWHDGDEWRPLPPYEFGLNVFEPYKGFIQGIAPKQLKDVIFVTSGELKNKVVKTIIASAYVIIFQDKNGREGQILRFRPFGDPRSNREEEAIAILYDETDKVLSGELLIGISTTNCKKIQEIDYANRP